MRERGMATSATAPWAPRARPYQTNACAPPLPASQHLQGTNSSRARRRARIEAHGDPRRRSGESADRPQGGRSGQALANRRRSGAVQPPDGGDVCPRSRGRQCLHGGQKKASTGEIEA